MKQDLNDWEKRKQEILLIPMTDRLDIISFVNASLAGGALRVAARLKASTKRQRVVAPAYGTIARGSTALAAPYIHLALWIHSNRISSIERQFVTSKQNHQTTKQP